MTLGFGARLVVFDASRHSVPVRVLGSGDIQDQEQPHEIVPTQGYLHFHDSKRKKQPMTRESNPIFKKIDHRMSTCPIRTVSTEPISHPKLGNISQKVQKTNAAIQLCICRQVWSQQKTREALHGPHLHLVNKY